MKFKKLYLGLMAGTATIGAGTGIGFAAWSATGSGNAGAAAIVAQGVTLTAVTPTGTAATLYPGGPPGSVYFIATNPNPYPVTITTITWGPPVSNNTSSCPNSNITVDANAPKTGLAITVPAGNPTGSISVPGVLDLSHAAPDGCQGISFQVPMTVSGMQQ